MLSPFYLSSFAWNLAHGMINVLVPLYALELGMSGVTIGSLLALPILLQVVFGLIGGAYVDRVGAKNMMHAACLLLTIASVIFLLSEGYPGLLLGFSLSVLSRATFWPANYALGSQLPGDRSRNMGWLNSVCSVGQIAGTAIAGMLIWAIGFMGSFWIAGACGLAATLLTSAMAGRPVTRSAQGPGIFATYRALAAQRPMYFCMACAYLAVLPFTIVASFGAILLVSSGYSTGATGWLLTLRAIGAIFAGTALVRVFRAPLDRRVPLWTCAAIGAGFGLLPVFDDPWPIGVFLFLLGLASGVISIYFQLLVSTISPDAQRGAAISYGGLGWNISNLTMPVIMGAFMDAFDIRTAFYLLGAMMLVGTALLVPLYRWAFPAGIPAERH
jgi:MFS family permease